MDDNINVLNEIHEGLLTNLNSISNISDNVSDNDFRKILTSQYNEYNTFLNKVNFEFSKLGQNPKDIPIASRIMNYMNNKIKRAVGIGLRASLVLAILFVI